MKWFDIDKDGDEYKYKVKTFNDACHECGSLWCLYRKHATVSNAVLDDLMEESDLSKGLKRYIAYKKATSKQIVGGGGDE